MGLVLLGTKLLLTNLKNDMDYLAEIEALYKAGVLIHYRHETYKDGTNTNFSIEFLKMRYPDGDSYQTGWYGDNHEFGDPHEVMRASLLFAKYLLEGDNLMWYFANPIDNDGYLLIREKREVIDRYLISLCTKEYQELVRE